MLVGRFFMIIPMLAIAGNLAKKKTVPASAGTFPVTTPLFTVLLVSVIVIVGALTFFPALSLGPVLEHLLMMAGKDFLRSHGRKKRARVCGTQKSSGERWSMPWSNSIPAP